MLSIQVKLSRLYGTNVTNMEVSICGKKYSKARGKITGDFFSIVALLFKNDLSPIDLQIEEK